MKRILLAVLVAVGITLGIAAPAQASYPIYTDKHWANDDIYVDDNTGWSWPVTKASARWSIYPNVVNVHYGTSCSVRCIRVYEVSSIPCSYCSPGTSIVGYAMPYYYNGVIVACKIVLSNQTALSYRLHVIVHEMGHCLGLKHAPTGTVSVMTPGSNYTYPTYIDWYNMRLNWYGVP